MIGCHPEAYNAENCSKIPLNWGPYGTEYIIIFPTHSVSNDVDWLPYLLNFFQICYISENMKHAWTIPVNEQGDLLLLPIWLVRTLVEIPESLSNIEIFSKSFYFFFGLAHMKCFCLGCFYHIKVFWLMLSELCFSS